MPPRAATGYRRAKNATPQATAAPQRFGQARLQIEAPRRGPGCRADPQPRRVDAVGRETGAGDAEERQRDADELERAGTFPGREREEGGDGRETGGDRRDEREFAHGERAIEEAGAGQHQQLQRDGGGDRPGGGVAHREQAGGRQQAEPRRGEDLDVQ
jgi:hypothetical protein